MLITPGAQHAMSSKTGGRWRPFFPLFILGLFLLLTLIFTRPLVKQLSTLSLGVDALVNIWILEWGKSSLLGGPQTLLNLPDGNIFYPYRYTFLFSEHLLPITALLLPGLVLLPGPLAALNLYTLLTFVLTGFGVWLLVAYWTGNRWVGIPAGVIVAFAPPRMFITDQPNIMTIQWMPFAILTFQRWLEKQERRDWWLTLLFVNLQILSATNYLAHIFLILAILFGVYILVYRKETVSHRKVVGTLALAVATALINAPSWWAYFHASAMLGIERDLGAVYLGSAHPLNYLMATRDNLIYGTLVPRLAALIKSSSGFRPVLSLFPGFTAMLLALVALILLPRPWTRRQKLGIVTLLAWLIVGFFMSLGVNDQALGPGLAPYLQFLLPYRWLYNYVPGFRGFRVPARFAILVLLALGGLGAFGVLALVSRVTRFRANPSAYLALGLAGLVAIEFITLPLGGERYPYGADLPPVYAWLASSTDPEAVIVELPYDHWSYMYYAVFHGRRIVNGTSGFNPPPLGDEAANLLSQFPDWRSIEWLQRLGVEYVVLHAAAYDRAYGPGAWKRVWEKLPASLASFGEVIQAGDDFVIRLLPPLCPTQPDDIKVSMVVNKGDGSETGDSQIRLSFANPTAAGYASDPNLPSFLTTQDEKECTDSALRSCRVAFHEPLVLLPGQTTEVTISSSKTAERPNSGVVAALSNLKRSVSVKVQGSHEAEIDASFETGHPEGIVSDFEGGARLLGYQLSSEDPVLCQTLDVMLYWQAPTQSAGEEKVTVELVDGYGWPVVGSQLHPWNDLPSGSPVTSHHRLPIPSSLPAGQYTLSVRLQQPDDAPLSADTPNGRVERLPLSPVRVRPQPPDLSAEGWQLVEASVADTVDLVAYRLDRTQLLPGDWLRLTLVWQAKKAPGRDATVFTQLIGPDGQVWGQQDNPPRGGRYPTSLWQPGELLADDYLLQVKSDAPPGRYSLVAGMYLPDTLERLPIQPSDSRQGTDALILTEIEVLGEE